ncbi:outer membrane protein assembly factor BamE [uncultured Oxalicibacterium sp.]|uniref:outer membrane protein assembly factor BamE n=1 Tax=uncultured Oxalicibacterium sp. TaxID=1168540 RepID=UPI0025E98DEC|nr:outer membrane protein assembly factor BamE [uncultured Oxalicibacterium sp.]
MPILPSQSGRTSFVVSALCLTLAALVAGCATKKNPLIDEPAPKAEAEASKAAATEQAAGSSVQTVQQKRFLGFLRPYRPDIQQGNFVSREMVAQLRPGMTQDQVIFLLGTPLLTDMFHADRWDYAFRMQKGNGEVTTSRVTVFFQDRLVSRFEGGEDLPTEQDYLDRLAKPKK